MNILITLKPHSTKGPLIELQPDGSLLVFIRQIAVEGKANDALIKLLADHYSVAKSRITIMRGHTSRRKTVSVDL